MSAVADTRPTPLRLPVPLLLIVSSVLAVIIVGVATGETSQLSPEGAIAILQRTVALGYLQLSEARREPAILGIRIDPQLKSLREKGVLIIGSGFMTHGLPFIREYMGTGKQGAPTWSVEFDRWAQEALERRDLDTLIDFRDRAPGMPYAHPTAEHFAPLFVALGAATVPDAPPDSAIEGYWYGLSKRSFEMR